MIRIYYKDGSTYDGAPENAPVFDVLIIQENDKNHGRRVLTNGDYFCYDVQEGRWWAYDFPGMIQYLKDPGWNKVSC